MSYSCRHENRDLRFLEMADSAIPAKQVLLPDKSSAVTCVTEAEE